MEIEVQRKTLKDILDQSLGLIGISPLKTHGLRKDSKVKAACEKLEKSFETQKDIVANVFEMEKRELYSSSTVTKHDNEILQKSKDFDKLLYLMKEKLQDKTLNIRWKIQILTIAPASWSRADVAKFFNVSEYMVRKAQKLASNKGILEIPDPKRGKTLSPEIEESVLQFYEDGEYSRLMPGAKDFVSVGKKVHVQKRLFIV